METLRAMIDWESHDTHILVNPRLSKDKIPNLTDLYKLKGHIWVTTSGSTSLKWVALSKRAFLTSAEAVNKHLYCDATDIWINPLPDFHVGGLSIWARAFLSRAKVFDYKKIHDKWDSIKFTQACKDNEVTRTSLVPAQLYDLVDNGLSPPDSLKSVVIGGGVLSDHVFDEAKRLGWPVIPSYGMTECASQIATATLNTQKLKILSHVDLKIVNGLIALRSSSLFTTYALSMTNSFNYLDPKEDGWFITEDRGEVQSGYLTVLGREKDFIKIGGENSNLSKLESVLVDIKTKVKYSGDLALIAYPDRRLGHVIHLVYTKKNDQLDEITKLYNQMVMPFEVIRDSHSIQCIPRSNLNKILRNKLQDKVLNLI